VLAAEQPRGLHVGAHEDVDRVAPLRRRAIEHEEFALEALDADALAMRQALLGEIRRHRDRAESGRDLIQMIAPRAFDRIAVGLRERRVVRGRADRQALLLRRRRTLVRLVALVLCAGGKRTVAQRDAQDRNQGDAQDSKLT
jgi:hypothetical protein